MIQGSDGTIQAIYSCFIEPEVSSAENGKKPPTLKGIKHAAFNESWVRAGD